MRRSVRASDRIRIRGSRRVATAVATLCVATGAALLPAAPASAVRTVTISFLNTLAGSGDGRIAIVCRDDTSTPFGTTGVYTMNVAEGNIGIGAAVAAGLNATPLPGMIAGSALGNGNVVSFKTNDVTACNALETLEVGNFRIVMDPSGYKKRGKARVKIYPRKLVVPDEDRAFHNFRYTVKNHSGTTLGPNFMLQWKCVNADINATLINLGTIPPGGRVARDGGPPTGEQIRIDPAETHPLQVDRGRCFAEPADPSIASVDIDPMQLQDGPDVPSLGRGGRASLVAVLLALGSLMAWRRARDRHAWAALGTLAALAVVLVPARGATEVVPYRLQLDVTLGDLPSINATGIGTANVFPSAGQPITLSLWPLVTAVTSRLVASVRTHSAVPETVTWNVFQGTSPGGFLSGITTTGSSGLPTISGARSQIFHLSFTLNCAGGTCPASAFFPSLGPATVATNPKPSFFVGVGRWAFRATNVGSETPSGSLTTTPIVSGFKEEGMVQLVAPIQIAATGGLGGSHTYIGGFAGLKIELLPEPVSGTAFLVGAALVAALGRRRLR